jgi:multiple sugar transport system permease protein
MDASSERRASALPENDVAAGSAGAAAVRAAGYGAARTRVRRRPVPFSTILANLTLAALGIAFVVPMLWVVLAAFDSHASNALQWPHLSLDNFSAIFAKSLVIGPFTNSLYLSGATTVITTLLAVMAAYPLSRRRIPGKRPFLYTILFATGLPVNMLLVPIYSLFVNYGMIDSLTWISFFQAAVSLPFAIWILKNFIDAIPVELEEAAQVDGASSVQTLRWVAVPLALPGIAVTAMFTFLAAWSTFLVPYILVETPGKLPFAVTIYQFIGAYGVMLYGQIAAASLIFSLPVVILYWAVSRHLAGAFNFGGGIQG